MGGFPHSFSLQAAFETTGARVLRSKKQRLAQT
jgi:hypothetical protein